MEQIIAEIHGLHSHSALEQLSWIAQIVIAAVAIITAGFAGWQLFAIRQESVRQTEQMRATFLFELDKMFESAPLARARANFATLKRDVDEYVTIHHPHLAASDRIKQIAEEFSKRLYELRAQNLQVYVRLMTLCGFFETAGMLVKKNYVAKDAIDSLYGGAIIEIYRATRRHIEKRQEEMPPGYLENFKFLASSISPSEFS